MALGKKKTQEQILAERRQYARIKKNFLLRYFDLEHPERKYSTSQLKNISLGGMCLVTEKSFPRMARLGVELKTSFISTLLVLNGTVLESHERVKDIIYETRLKFDEIPPSTKSVLQKLIKHFETVTKENDE
ncbi:MAG: PilZ domain-containing protein [Candidatus Omnitrophica bacterium]|nr:PilZ domain-containing protein [Candidatus Omnitrophota bacterium]